MPPKTNWPAAIRPLLEKYNGKRHPLQHRNTYQLIVMVVLSAQSTDDVVNQVAPAFFNAYPNLAALSAVRPEDLFPLIGKIRNFGHKAAWLVAIAKQLGTDEHIPLTMDELTALPGIGRKSASVILREAGKAPEGVIVDIHVVRVAPRLGIAKDPDPKKMEQQLMKKLPRDEWDAGMAMSFLGREICRPKPECERCLMNPVCAYYARSKKTEAGAAKKTAEGSPKKTGQPKKTRVKSPEKTVKEKVKKRAGRSGK
ncbi:MAG TPA: endonuclease III [Puia sp.]|nr:endonuclease III [Puia sp.]